MARNNDELLKRLLATFRVEADEHLKAMSLGLVALETTPAGEERTALVERIFRDAHSLKGAARAVNLLDVESVCQSLESVFAGLKTNRLAATPTLFDRVHEAIDAVSALVAPESGAAGSGRPAIAVLVRRLDDALKGPLSEAPAEPNAVDAALVPAPSLAAETVRVSTAKLDAVMRQVEELLSPRLAAGQRVNELRETGVALAAWKTERARIQPALRMFEQSLARGGKANGELGRRQELSKLLEYVDSEDLSMKALEDRLARLKKSAERDQRALAAMTDSLLHDVKEMHLLPFSSLLEMLPRLARDLARNQGKQVELSLRGGEIEVDRRILEEIKDPLIHMLRNCIDHGVEPPAVREGKRKPPQGNVAVAISQTDSGKVEILVSDDGAGIDAGKVMAAARRIGAVSADEAEKFGEEETRALVFRSGLSTSPIVTDLSGRGLGLAIVREKVERLGGAIGIASRPGAGTSIRIALPLTIATFRGILVRAGERLLVIPAVSVERVLRVPVADVRTVENRQTIPLGGQAVSLVSLGDVLELPRSGTPGGSQRDAQVVVIALGGVRIGFRVDEILGEQEVLVKLLGPQLARVRNIAGASVLGTGQVAPVLNVPDLLKSAVKPAAAPHTMPVAGEESAAEKAGRSVLVVEDSITSRALLKGILESAGYRVATAVDGIDAYTALKAGEFDLVVSDVEMPRMDGFDLTARLRSDKRFAELPIVLVTALESREHRERGIDAGANAYIVKSSFDQSNLLEVVRRLI
ncbi:MAG: response regulator [Betaproteobacteria bacterium]|nr:response regulator [Betaproteobacteria bacterium]